MVDGDFKKFEGKWSLKFTQRSCMTILSYQVNVIPRFNFPAIFLERIIRSDPPVNLQALVNRAEKSFEGSQNVDLDGAIGKKAKLKDEAPLPRPSSELNSKWGVFGNVCRLDRPCMVAEVHLWRLDGLLLKENGGVHRCVVASITVKATVPEVWKVLTAYETLPK
ncbi:Coenzyme Q-binding protein COQ10, START domain [Dillenia turbinata]|uniref:Coenzyme Q-binding protein COQ10, START domain n=1 Tax=Dillenia turbinata TaxID=194707 RepID=A0AAN8W2R4_9MAGN